jgi:hypothetical protein
MVKTKNTQNIRVSSGFKNKSESGEMKITREAKSSEEALETIGDEESALIIAISEKLQPLNDEKISKLSEILREQQVIALQSSLDGKFLITWKLKELHILRMFDEVKREDLAALCRFIVQFIAESLSANHAGKCETSSSNIIDILTLDTNCSH